MCGSRYLIFEKRDIYLIMFAKFFIPVSDNRNKDINYIDQNKQMGKITSYKATYIRNII